MKKSILTLALFWSLASLAQDVKISTIDFVQIQNENREETIYYYENNWLVLRKMALERSIIDSYELIEVESSEEAPFHLILKTTYANRAAFDLAEEKFAILIEEKGPRRLLNDKQPGDFRKIIFSKEAGEHLY